jgi:sterol desaturase/sphingolipid hydroxylase (fatty acid hydroxylase superfamily)
VIKDFLDWLIHNLLHRTPVLWEFHKLHHSITEMDWIGNFRFHWTVVLVYQTLTYLPLVVLGVDGQVILLVAVFATLIGHLSHSNIDISWGPLRYLLNSSRMHIWHHMRDLPEGRRSGVNFGISLSIWDWIFGTAYWPTRDQSPAQQPESLGFPGMEKMPRSLAVRFVSPVWAALRVLFRIR